MLKQSSMLVITAALFFTDPGFAQGSTAPPFLLISPYTESNGMGVPRLLRALDVPLATEGVARFLLNHINVSYNHCEWTPDDPLSPLKNTKFDSINFSIMN